MKKKLLTICLIAALAASVFAFVACDPDPPEAKEGVIYQSDIETLWVVVGKAYITLEVIPEPETPVEGEQYGNVFKVNVDPSGEGYSAWLVGTWSIENDVLTVTATWDETAENQTSLEGAQSGVAKTYTADNGAFKIKVNVPGAGAIEFELKPVEDATTGGNGTTDPDDGTTGGNGTADPDDGKTGGNGTTDPDDGTVEPMVTLTATDSGMQTKIRMYADNTFKFSMQGFGDLFGGTWAFSDASNPLSPIVLTFDATGSAVVGETVNVTVTPQAGVVNYSCHVDYVVPETITLSLDFTGTYVIPA